ncbi:hypothetical protein QBC38DRAFT_459344 [Podospora fimiseda]|uniref:Cytochrome P450 n=1 Tax=Podospora fimiseda TaxID=252190 RepID=A0AAN7BHS3_9PEZI|nr:hypothetical protein QBC38DRAFT_459344 [Podospora fimiseda]
MPPRTMIIPSYSSVQTDPRFWGEKDCLECKPQRWIDDVTREWIHPAKRGSFIGWSEGARDCAGKKLSQVEVVATLAVLLRDWTVEPVLFEEKTVEEGKRRVLKVIEGLTPVVLVQMNGSERTPLFWKRREYTLSVCKILRR